MKRKIKTVSLLLVFAAGMLLLSTCSGGSGGDDTAIISISLSIGSTADKAASRAEVDIDELRHEIKLSGPGETQTYTIMGSGTINASVYPGLWRIDVEGYLDEDLYSVGSASADVKARKTTNVSIEMTVVWAGPEGKGRISGGGGGGGGGGRRLTTNSIKFLDSSPTITKVYGTPLFTNGIDPVHNGYGAITYSSSDPLVASVDAGTGEVTILKTGSTDIIAVKAADSVYAGTQTQYELVVTKALLTVTADNKILGVFDPVPAYTYTPSGFAYSDTASALSGTPAFSCAYTSTSPKGSYPITITRGTLDSENYDFKFVDGSVSVGLANQAPLTIVKPSTITYGDLDFILSTTGGSGTGVTVNFTLVSGSAISLSGTYNETASIQSAGTATVKATKEGDSDYNPVEEIVTITVNKRDLSNATVTVGGAAEYTGSPQEAGSPLSLTVEDWVSLVNIITGFDYDVSYSANKYPGTATVTISASSGGNYTGAPQTASFTIDPKALTVAVSTTKTYDGGNSLGSTPTVTLGGKIGTEDVDVGTLSATYTGVNAGTNTITITSLSLSGGDNLNYTIPATYLSPNTVTVTGGGITPATGSAVTPTLSLSASQTNNYISVTTVTLVTSTGQTVNYGWSTTSGLTDSSTLSGKGIGTSWSVSSAGTYYVYAYAAGNLNYNEGALQSIAVTVSQVIFRSEGLTYSTVYVVNGYYASSPGTNPTKSYTYGEGLWSGTLSSTSGSSTFNGWSPTPSSTPISGTQYFDALYTDPTNYCSTYNGANLVYYGVDYVNNNNGNYTMFIASGGPYSLGPGLTINNSGYTLTMMGISGTATIQLSGSGYLFTVANGSTLTISSSIALQGFSNNASRVVLVSQGATVELYGTITGNEGASLPTGGGGGIGVAGTLNMYIGSLITNNSTVGDRAGGVSVTNGGTFNMYGGTISYNSTLDTVNGGGAGVAVYNNAGGISTFNMYGGEIFENTATLPLPYGGVDVMGNFNLYLSATENNIHDNHSALPENVGGVGNIVVENSPGLTSW